MSMSSTQVDARVDAGAAPPGRTGDARNTCRWRVLAVIGPAQLMVVLDVTIVVGRSSAADTRRYMRSHVS
jgi:hypothetical protein